MVQVHAHSKLKGSCGQSYSINALPFCGHSYCFMLFEFYIKLMYFCDAESQGVVPRNPDMREIGSANC